MVFMIAYDLRSPNDGPQDYERVISHIKAKFNWCHLEKSVWLVEAALNATEIREVMQPYVRSTDALFVARLQGNWSSWSLGTERNNWLRNQTFWREGRGNRRGGVKNMKDLPFGAYDFFGYIASGLVLVVVAQLILGFPKIFGTDLKPFDIAVTILGVYIAGQIVAGPGKSLALIGNASGHDAEGARNCSEAFSIRRLEGRRWQWWALLWSCGRDSAPVKEGKSLEMGGGRRFYTRWGCVEGVIPRSARSQEPPIRR